MRSRTDLPVVVENELGVFVRGGLMRGASLESVKGVNPMPRISVNDIIAKKRAGQKITMLTAYDFTLAGLVDAGGVDIILVGDSLANVMLGLETTREVSMAQMIHHARAVSRAVGRALVVGDMPYEACQLHLSEAVANARQFIQAGCDAVKIEWFDQCPEVVGRILGAGIPVMGHAGLTPQRAQELGGMKVQGREAHSAIQIVEQARVFEKAGCFSLVLECVPDRLAGLITGMVAIPTIGIGAGSLCDGQVLVLHDLLGLLTQFRPRFAKAYIDGAQLVRGAVEQFREEVRGGQFPEAQHGFTINDEEFAKLRGRFFK